MLDSTEFREQQDFQGAFKWRFTTLCAVKMITIDVH